MSDRCAIVDVDGEPVRVHGDLRTEQDQAAFAEIVRAARRRFEADLTPERAEQLARIQAFRALWLRARLGPAPLCINGHAYRRRSRNRRKRR